MTENNKHEDIPYYHSNIQENQEKIYIILGEYLKTHGKDKDTFVYVDEDETPDKATCKEAEWSEPELGREFIAAVFDGESELLYGSHRMLTIIEHYGEESSEKVHVFNYQTIPGHEGYTHVTHIIRQTTQQRQEREELRAAHKEKYPDSNFMILPGSTDDIANEIEMLLYAVEKQVQKHKNM